MIGSIFSKISKKSYYKSIYLHLSVLLFIIIPLSFLVPKYLDSGKTISTGEIKLITISEADYDKIVKKTTKASTITPNEKNVPKDTKEEFIKIVKKDSPKPKPSLPKKSPINNKQISPNKTNNTPQNNINNIAQPSFNGDQEKLLLDMEGNGKTEQDTIDIVNSDAQKTTIFGDVENVSTQDVQVSIKDIVAVQINKCWNEYYDANLSNKNMVVTAVIGYRQNGNVNKIEIENKLILDSTDNDLYQIMIQNVKRAIISCSPLKGLPISTYDEWSYIKINFKHGKKAK